METNIKLKKDNVLKVRIQDEDGNDTGNFLEFDLEDISLPLRIQQLQDEHKKNLNYIKMSFALIDKKPNKEGKKILSSNEEEKLKVIKAFYEKEMKILDLALGKGATEKLLNGRNPYYEMFDDIISYLEPLKPYFEEQGNALEKKLIEKYSKRTQNTDTLEIDE